MDTGVPSPQRSRRGQGKRDQQFTTRVGGKQDILFVLTAIGLASLLLAFVAFTRPLTQTALADINYEHRGVFSYTASAPFGLYDSDTLQTGEAVFPKLTSTVHFRFDYQLGSGTPPDINGSSRLVVQVSDTSGWKRTIELQPETTFTGTTATLEGEAHLDQIQKLISQLKEQTGLVRQSFTVTVWPSVHVQGKLSGEEFEDTFAPRLDFLLDDVVLQMVRPDPSRPDPLTPTQAAILKQPRVEPNVLSLLGLKLSVRIARWIAAIGIALSLGGLAVLLVPLYRAARASEIGRIQVRYGSMLVAVRSASVRAGESVVEVASIDDLAKVAEKDGRMILHLTRGAAHTFLVRDVSGVVYRYRVTDSVGKPEAREAGEENKSNLK